MPLRHTDLAFRASLQGDAPNTAHAIRMLNAEIATATTSSLTAAQLLQILKREALLIKAAAREHKSIRRLSRSAD